MGKDSGPAGLRRSVSSVPFPFPPLFLYFCFSLGVDLTFFYYRFFFCVAWKESEMSVAFTVPMAQDPRERKLSSLAPISKIMKALFHLVWVAVMRGMDTLIGQPGTDDHFCVRGYG